MNWINIEKSQDIANLLAESNHVPCLIFKHSSQCTMSAMAKYTLEEEWNLTDEELKPYFLDILKYRNLAIEVSEQLKEYHQSPQVLLIENEECIYEESHLAINLEEIREEIGL